MLNNILRFYGSCGHIDNELISEETMIKFSSERIVKTIFGDFVDKCKVTVEENNKVVHVYPDRFFLCKSCMEEEMKNN